MNGRPARVLQPAPARPVRRAKGALVSTCVLAFALLLSACAGGSTAGGPGGGLGGTVNTDGSSTVAPLTNAAAHMFAGAQPDVDVLVTVTGTSAGFRAFCNGQTDISNASRAITDEEDGACEEAGVDYTEIVVANDGLSVILNPENDWATDLTVEQLSTIWAPASAGQIVSWRQVDPAFPDEPLVLFGAGKDSGTLDYFSAAINGEEGAIRQDYSASENDDVTVQGVAENRGAIGFVGLSYVETSQDAVVAASIDGISPTAETVQDGSYTPLSRPLFIYVNDASYADKPQVKGFVDFYVETSLDVAERARVVPLTDAQIEIAQEELASLG